MIASTLGYLDAAARLIRRLSNSMLPVGVTLVCVISVVSVYGVAERMRGNPLSWTIEFTELLQVALAFLPVAYVLNANKHVSMELLQTVLGERGRRAARIVYSFVGMVLAAMLTYSTCTVAIASVAMDESTVVAILPIYPAKICVTLGFALLTLQFAGHFWECVRNMPECVIRAHQSESYV